MPVVPHNECSPFIRRCVCVLIDRERVRADWQSLLQLLLYVMFQQLASRQHTYHATHMHYWHIHILEKLAGKITTSKQLIVSSWLYALTHSTEMTTFWCTIYSISDLFSPLSWVLSYLSWFSLQPPGYTIKQSFNICSNLTVGFGQEERSRLPENRQWIIKTYFIQEQWNCFHCRIIPTLHNGMWRPWERATDYL